MRRLTIATLVAMLIMLIPVLNTVLEHGTDDFIDYVEIVISLEDYLDGKDLGEESFSVSWFGSSTHSLNTSSVTTIDVLNQGTWYNDIESYGYPFSYNFSASGDIELGHASGATLTLYEDGSVNEFYWSVEHDETRINYVGHDEDKVLFYSKVFYQDGGLTYAEVDFSDTRTIGLEYVSDNNTGGYSAYDLGVLAIEDGLFGMLPRLNNDNEWEFPLIGHFSSSLSIVGDFVWDSAKVWWDNAQDQIIYDEDYYEIGTKWTTIDSMGRTYYIVDDAGFWGGERIKATISVIDTSTTLVVYQLQSKRFWIWNDMKILTDEDMEDYKTSTTNFS